MPRIPFPDVPVAPGVPEVPRRPNAEPDTGLDTSAADADGPMPQDLPTSQWQILFEDTGAVALAPDSVVALDFRNDQLVATHPVEQGAFSSYSKVGTPFALRLRMTCGGQQAMPRDEFLARLNSLVQGTDLLTIVAPDRVHEHMNADHLDYRREATSGVSLLTVEVWFTEIRTTAVKTSPPTAEPSGASQVNVGYVQPQTPNSSVQAAIKNSRIQ